MTKGKGEGRPCGQALLLLHKTVRPLLSMTKSKATRAAEIQDSIRQILYHDWDPIGFGSALPKDEYDSYITPIFRVLAGSRSEQELIDLLFNIERDTIGVPRESPSLLRPVARRLLQLDVKL